MRTSYFFYSLLLLFLLACDEDGSENLPSVEERLSTAINNLRSDLTAPANGWILEYRPNENSGFYNVLLKFEPDGKVNIQTDSPISDGEFFNQTASYRIDSSQGLELILENYGFFHFLFEQNQTTFGGEFEFLFDRKEGDDLIFGSISDFSDRTILVFKPASASDEASVQNSRELAELLEASLEGSGPQVFSSPRFQLAIPSLNVTIYFVFNFNTRTLKAIAASEGLTEEEVLANNNSILLNQNTGYGLAEGNILLQEPLAFVLGSTQVVVSRIALTDVTEGNISYCEGIDGTNFTYQGSVLGSGDATAITGLFAGRTGFQQVGEGPYSAPDGLPFSVLDENIEEIDDEVLAVFPDAFTFQMYYGFDFGDEPFNALGFVTIDENNEVDFFLRRYEFTAFGNLLTINFLDDYFTTRELTEDEEAGFIALTDNIFEGNQVYTLDIAGRDDLFVLYNPCNQYEIILLN